MKTLFFSRKTVSLFLFTLAVFAAHAQIETRPYKADTLPQLINAKHYTIVATTAMPLSGNVRQLTSYYSLKVSGDSVICDLPYFGRAYTAPLDPSEAGIQFTTTKFDYTSTERKKGRWEITIVPKNVSTADKLFITIFSNGNATI